MTAAIVGIDVGTTACKGLLLGLDGAVLAEASAGTMAIATKAVSAVNSVMSFLFI